MNKYVKAAPLVVALMLTGCNDEPTYDVEYYKTHEKERTEKLAECKNNPGELRETPNCINAQKAHTAIIFNPKLKDAPSIN
ncbi:EexN family lipoprotein [Marinobacterium sp. BA1]|jgi:hypothetical protein|uniref:EexN family lipoprotein n=1 Tax=Marinobacterium sp. BA1 TaxID=3138931 RepID=UPI0032E65D7B